MAKLLVSDKLEGKAWAATCRMFAPNEKKLQGIKSIFGD
jgi:hypothetical protein